jgi:hypothetical protein
MLLPGEITFHVPDQSVFHQSEGGFARRVLILASAKGDEAASRAFLEKVLSAAKIELATDALLAKVAPEGAARLFPDFSLQQPAFVLVFGLAPAQLGLRLDVPLYQPFAFSGAQWLFADALPTLEPDRAKKSQLWAALQAMFL